MTPDPAAPTAAASPRRFDLVLDPWASLCVAAAVWMFTLGLMAVGRSGLDPLAGLLPAAAVLTALSYGVAWRRAWGRWAWLAVAWTVIVAPLLALLAASPWWLPELFEHLSGPDRPHHGLTDLDLMVIFIIFYAMAAAPMGLLVWRLRRSHVRAQFARREGPWRLRRRHASLAAGVTALAAGCGTLAVLGRLEYYGLGLSDLPAVGWRVFEDRALAERAYRNGHARAEQECARLAAAIVRGDTARLQVQGNGKPPSATGGLTTKGSGS